MHLLVPLTSAPALRKKKEAQGNILYVFKDKLRPTSTDTSLLDYRRNYEQHKKWPVQHYGNWGVLMDCPQCIFLDSSVISQLCGSEMTKDCW